MNEPLRPAQPILVIDDEPSWLHSFEMTLRSAGLNHVLTCADSRRVMDIVSAQEVELVLLDLWMPHVSGEDLLPRIRETRPDAPVIVITALDDVERAVRCMKLGAADYLVKPIERERLVSLVERMLHLRALERENEALKKRVLFEQLERPEAFGPIITKDRGMRSLFLYLEAVAPTRESVLITGETGTGKELVARAVHELSGVPGAFVPVNIAGIDETAFTDTLFGHQKGAFTGAGESREGLVKQAAGGTLFLDEIGDLDPACQTKLLRLLQEREYLPLGSDRPQHSDARIVVATQHDPASLQESGHFRADLFYRLRRHHVHIPPLRERLGDLPLLVDHFLEEASQKLGKKAPTPPPELLTLLETYAFPGNVRELESMVLDAVTTHQRGKLSLATFKAAMRSDHVAPAQTVLKQEKLFASCQPLPTLREAQALLTVEALRRAQGNQTIAARQLGISRQALHQRLKKLDSRMLDASDRQNPGPGSEAPGLG